MSATITIYGLATCDTTRAARKWLDGRGLDYVFHDVRADGLTRALVERWVGRLGWEKVLNKASTTWRELAGEAKEGVDARKAVSLVVAHPTLLKRPLLDMDGELTAGFKPGVYEKLFS